MTIEKGDPLSENQLHPSESSEASAEEGKRARTGGSLRAWWVAGGRVDTAWALGTAVATVLVATFVFKWWRASLNVQWTVSSSGDGFFYQTLARNIEKSGWVSSAPQLNAPFGMNFNQWPGLFGDTWHFVALKVFSAALNSAGMVNLFWVLTFPAVALLGFVALRVLGITRLIAAALAIVYSIIPYHIARGEGHLFLSDYAAVPLACALAVPLSQGRFSDRLGRRRPFIVLAVVAAVLLAGTGVYYGAIAALLVLFASLLGTIAKRRWRFIGIGAAFGAATGVVMALLSIPVIIGSMGPDAPHLPVRPYSESEMYGLKIDSMLLPPLYHRVEFFARVAARVTGQVIDGEAWSSSLGFLGAIGLAIAVVAALARPFRTMSAWKRDLTSCGILIVVLVLWAVPAGGDGLFAVFGFTELHSPNRVVVFVSFLSLFVLGRVIDQVVATYDRWPISRRSVSTIIALVVCVFAWWDQTSPGIVPNYAAAANGWNQNEAYFGQLQTTLGADTSVFMLPITGFPPPAAVANMAGYAHFVGYMHSDMKWSYGEFWDVRGPGWQLQLADDAPKELLPKVVAAGFTAIFVNRTGYTDNAAAVEKAIQQITGVQPLVSPDGTYATYDLRAYAEQLKASGGLPSAESVLGTTP